MQLYPHFVKNISQFPIGSNARTHGRSKSAIMKPTGIKRRPILSRLSLKFPDAFPYDSMHLLLQGWVKLLIMLLCGIHPKTVALNSPFVLGSDSLSRMNNALQHSSRGFPAAWGRPPPSIEMFAPYKAETFKTFGLFHGPALFSGTDINGRVSELWAATRDILFIAFDPTPSLNDVGYLSRLVQRAHALFTIVFRVNDSHNFCFTPTTHAILHLPDVMRKCGPLMNTSQFLPERVMGEVKRRAQSRVLPEANLFHKTQMLFGMKMFGGGLRYSSQSIEISRKASSDSTHGNEVESIQSDRWKMVGRGEIISSGVVKRRILAFLKGHGFHERADTISVYEHNSATFTRNGIMLYIETAKAFREREKSSGQGKAQCRQKYWILAEFVCSDGSSEGAEELTDVYYGKVLKIWNVLIRSTDSNHYVQFAEIEWQNGMHIDSKSGAVYTKLHNRGRKGTIRDATSSLEMISCIKRLVAFLDYGERRYFFDMYSPRMLKISNSELKGVMER